MPADTSRITARAAQAQHGPIVSAGILIGAGLGGFVDGIVFHQLLQWHNMLSSVRPPTTLVEMKCNMLWDGVFHAFAWTMTAFGVGRLWRAGQRPDVAWSTRTFAGALLLGWGAFNVIEGVIDHHLLTIHRVRPGVGELGWDLAFLGFGLVLVGAGLVLVRAGRVVASRGGSRDANRGE